MPAQSTPKPRFAARHPKLAARRRAWTPERRARQSALMRRVQPWTRATGPRTAAGKAVCARNRAKPRSTALRQLNAALRLHRRFLNLVKTAERLGLLRTRAGKAAFLARLAPTELAIDRVTATLYHAMSLFDLLDP